MMFRDNYGKDEHYWSNSTNDRSRVVWEGLAFEQVCKDHIMAIKHKLGIPGILTEESSWFVRGDKRNLIPPLFCFIRKLQLNSTAVRRRNERNLIGVWGVINLLEGYGNDNAGSKSQGIKQLMAGGGIIILAQTVIPLLSSLFGGGGEGGGE